MPHTYDSIYVSNAPNTFPEASVSMPYFESLKQYVDPNQLLRIVQHCEATCEHMITMLLNYEEPYSRKEPIQLLRDCADVCGLMVKYLARKTSLAKSLAYYCSYVCEVCGKTCSRFPDSESQQCAQTCLNCAQECLSFSK